MLTSAITSHYGHHRLGIGNRHTQQIGHLPHGLSTTYGTEKSVEASGISTLDKCISHTATARESTSTAIGTRQQFADLCNAGIFIDSELLGGCKEYDGCRKTNGSKNDYCNQDEIHKYCYFICFSY
jgi:hypothetical protein